MKVINAIEQRYSVREYDAEKLSNDLILDVLDAGRLAPSACNKQPWRFVVLSDQERLSEVAATYPRAWFEKVPHMIVVCGMRNEAWERTASDNKNHMDVDVAIAVDHITLRAVELGLGTCWVCAFDPKKLNEILELPEGVEPVAIVTIGKPANQQQPPKKRKALDELVFFEKYGNKRNFTAQT